MDKENVVYVYNGVLVSLESKEISSFATIWMNLEDIL
jgi:hypothetical protein